MRTSRPGSCSITSMKLEQAKGQVEQMESGTGELCLVITILVWTRNNKGYNRKALVQFQALVSWEGGETIN